MDQQHGNSVSNRNNTMAFDPQLVALRQFVRDKIKQFIMQRQQNSHNLTESRILDIVRRLDQALWLNASTKEEYANIGTLANRLRVVINNPVTSSNRNQQYPQQHGNSPSVIGTMIPTPGVPPVSNSSLIPASSVGTAPMASTAGSMSYRYQQPPANFSACSSGNNASAVGVQRMPSQMIPTPGFNNSTDPSSVNGNSSHGSFSTVESGMLSQPVMQKQHVSGQTSRMSHNVESNQAGGVGSSYGFQRGAFNGGLNMAQSNLNPISGPGTAESYHASTQFGESTPQLFRQQYDHHQQAMQGDGRRTVALDSTIPGNFYGLMGSSGAGKNNHISKPPNFPSMPTTHSPMVVNQPNLQTAGQYAVDIIPIEQPENMNCSGLGASQESRSHKLSQQPSSHIHQQLYQQDQSNQQSQQHQDICSPMFQTSKQMHQLLDTQQKVDNCSDDMQAGRLIPGNWDVKFHNRSQATCKSSQEQSLQEISRQRMTGNDEAHRDNLLIQGDFNSTAITKTEPTNSAGISCISANPARERQFKNQRRWILLLLHARRCMAPEGKCQEAHCIKVQQLLKHMNRCDASPCTFPRCQETKVLVNHRKHCRDPSCPVCIPVKNFIEGQLKARARCDSNPSIPHSVNGSCEVYKNLDAAARVTPKTSPPCGASSEDVQSSLKRLKMEQNFQHLDPEGHSSSVSVPAMDVSDVSPCHEYKNNDPCTSTEVEITEVKMEIQSVPGSAISSDMKENMDDSRKKTLANEPSTSDIPANFSIKECNKSEAEVDQSKQGYSVESTSETKSRKPDLKGVSLMELFTPEQVKEHIRGLRQWVGQSKAKAEKNQAMGHLMSENSCQLCAAENLPFEPPPIYCTPCGARIKRNATYYAVGAGDTRHYFCVPCYNESRGDSILVDGTVMRKGKLEKKKNDEETDESWVQCDKCEAWQHQICALFNGRRNDGGQAEYTCPNCYVAEVEKGERNPLPQSAVLGAKDLPKTILSDHLEDRLFKRLKQERQERQDRARFQGKSYDEVPGAEALVVRVVSSVDKKLEVKPQFLEIFKEDNYPTEFPYKSKVVLLFQRIEGVEVCLFGMYVQEFGSECQQPNHRRVYLSYLDSVKYFRPDIKTVTGEALRTFVYHEILIGYLEYCKRRGFTSCYIWACPPLKGEDYILYCHPEIQKTPKSDKLREWYLSMLRKASKENVVVGLTNLHDHFFLSNGECKAKVTAVRLPYFDGDYWPGSAEDMIYQLRQEEEGRKQHKKGTNKKAITKRSLKAYGQADGNLSKDLLLMLKLGESIAPMKEDFIMVHLQHACSHCCLLMVFGKRWVCSLCKNFQLCDRCFEAEQKLEESERHPLNQRDKHELHPVVISDVPEDTKDEDEILESEFFDTRQAFLSLCQGNHYQYDTLRRAKHSSMMVLYHLHNPTAPAFVTTCNRCHLDIEAGQGWRCETCPDFDVCNSCFQKDGGIDHPHKLTNHPSFADCNAQNKEARQLRVVQLRKMLDLLAHASQCRSPSCQYPNCRKVKGLFRHGIHCKTRASGGCLLCKKMWYLLQLHARACKESRCHVPRCRDLNEHMRRLQQQAESRRRAAVTEMMRQRAAEVSGNNG